MAITSAFQAEDAGSIPVSRSLGRLIYNYIRPVRLAAKDAGFSLLRHGFESRTGYWAVAKSVKASLL